MLIYVDDIIVTGSNTGLINYLINLRGKEFSLNDFGELHYFLGIEVVYRHDGIILNQSRSAFSLLKHNKRVNHVTPLPPKYKLH